MKKIQTVIAVDGWGPVPGYSLAGYHCQHISDQNGNHTWHVNLLGLEREINNVLLVCGSYPDTVWRFVDARAESQPDPVLDQI